MALVPSIMIISLPRPRVYLSITPAKSLYSSGLRRSFLDISDSDTGFSAVIGGRIDVLVRRRVDLRLIQWDYNPARFNVADDTALNGRNNGSRTQHSFRIGVGIVIHYSGLQLSVAGVESSRFSVLHRSSLKAEL